MELVLAITAISALSVLTLTVICLLVTAEQHAAETLFVDVTVANLAADLRDDAHRAVDVEVAPPGEDGSISQVTLLQSEEAQVTYQCTADSVVRRQEKVGEVVATETYRLAFGVSRFEPPGESGVLIWTHQREIPNIGGFADATSAGAGVRRAYQITAALGLHAAMAEAPE